jgi:hypothetical protein
MSTQARTQVWMDARLCVRMGVSVCGYARELALTQTRTPPAVRQTHARTNTQAQTHTRACAHAHACAVQPNSYRCAHARVHRRTHKQTHSAGSRMRTHIHTHHTYVRARSCANTHTRVHARTRPNAHTHIRTYTCRRLTLPCLGVPPQGHAAPCGCSQRARGHGGSAACARRRRARDDRARVRRPVAIFGQRSACAAPAVAGRDGIAATQMWMKSHTHTHDSLTHTRTRIDVVDVEVCMRLDTHTDARTKAHARTRAQPRMYGCAHSAGLTRALTHAHT